MCRHCDRVLCSPVLYEWLLYCPSVATVIHLYVAPCYVSGYYIVHVSSLWYSYMCLMLCEWVLYLLMSRHCDRVICNLKVCEWLLYCSGFCHCDTVIRSLMLCESLLCCSCVFTVIQLHVAQCYVSGYYIVHVSSLWYSYM